MEESIFTKIIKGEIPCHKIYEDDQCIAFLDINPLTPGHTLVVPKTQIDELWDTSDELYQHLMMATRKIAKKQRDALKPKRVGIIVEGFEVPHAHIHVFPLEHGMRQTFREHASNPSTQPSRNELAQIATKLSLLEK